MPLIKCKQNGKSGWKWGKSGKCYTGPGAKDKALKSQKNTSRGQGRMETLIQQVAKIIEQNEK